MKITKVETFKVAVPYIPAIYKYRPTEHIERPVLIIRVHTDEGIIGLGEGGRGGNVDAQIPNWIGRDPLKENLALVKPPFNQALYDIVGKAWGVPAYRLMGSCYRDKVPVQYWSCYMEPEDTAKEAEVGAKMGFKIHKLKARPWNIVETVRLMTEAAGPDYAVVVDPNMGFGDLTTSIKLARQLEKYNIQCFEDPFSWHNWEQFALFRQKVDIPIAPHLHHPVEVLNAIKHEAADYFTIGCQTFDSTFRCAAIAHAANRPLWVQSPMGLGVGIDTAYATHMGAVVPNATIPDDILHFKENDLIGGGLELKEGHITVPQTPGLGVELDEGALEKYRVG